MSDSVVGVVTDMFLQLFGLVDRLFEFFNITPFLLGFFFIYTVIRMLLQPVIGGVLSSGTSDMVHRINKTGRHSASKK